MKAYGLVCCPILFMFACQREMPVDYEISAVDAAKELSHTPVGEVSVNTTNMNIKIDFNCDEYMASHILSEYGQVPLDTIHTLGRLIRFYEARQPNFEYSYSSHLNPYSDNDYVFPKMEYLLAQECFQEGCSSQTRKVVLQIAINKQQHKYEEDKRSFTARQTGIFLIAVILVKEKDTAFVAAVAENRDFQDALCLNQNIRTDMEFCDNMIQFAKRFLLNK
jgi:hypothetical protein